MPCYWYEYEYEYSEEVMASRSDSDLQCSNVAFHIIATDQYFFH